MPTSTIEPQNKNCIEQLKHEWDTKQKSNMLNLEELMKMKVFK